MQTLKNFPYTPGIKFCRFKNKMCINDWPHVPTKLNPADHASRGCAANLLIGSNPWFEGPEFLKRPLSEWPKKLSFSLEKESV